MKKEEFDIDQELEQMRQDYAASKERFDKQQIINEQLMQNAMKKDVRRLFLSKKSIPATIALFIIAVILCYFQGFDWWVPLSIIIYGLLTITGIFWVYKESGKKIFTTATSCQRQNLCGNSRKSMSSW